MKKLIVFFLKAVPVVGALCCALNSTLSYYGINLIWLGYVAHSVFLIAWILLAYYFRFCSFYYMLVVYILAAQMVNLMDYTIGLPLTDWEMFVFHAGLIGFMLLFFTYTHVRDTRNLKKRIDEDGTRPGAGW